MNDLLKEFDEKEKKEKNAADDLIGLLNKDEKLEAIVFGPWGWGSTPREGENWELGYGEPKSPPVPFEHRGNLLSFEEAKPFMESWSFYGSFGAPACYAIYAWSNKRVFWVTQYDGSTGLCWAPRHPTDNLIPDMPGG